MAERIRYRQIAAAIQGATGNRERTDGRGCARTIQAQRPAADCGRIAGVSAAEGGVGAVEGDGRAALGAEPGHGEAAGAEGERASAGVDVHRAAAVRVE